MQQEGNEIVSWQNIGVNKPENKNTTGNEGGKIFVDEKTKNKGMNNKYWMVVVVVLSILAVTGFTLAIIGFTKEKKSSIDNNDSDNNMVVETEFSSYVIEEKTQEWIEDLANKAIKEVSIGNNSIYHDKKDNGIYYKPNHLSTRVEGTGYENVLNLKSEDKELASNLREAIENELIEEEFIIEEQIINEESKYDLYVNEDNDVLCEMGNDTKTLIMCSEISSQYPEEGSEYANEVNQLAEAYKEKTGSYPSLVNLKSGWTQGGNPYIITVLNSQNDTRYEILVNGLNFAIPHYFYRTENGVWKYPVCDNGLNSEEENLFKCVPFGSGPDSNALPTIPALKVGNGIRI